MPAEKPAGLSRRQFLMTATTGLVASQLTGLEALAAAAGVEDGSSGRARAPFHPSDRTWQASWIWDRTQPVREQNIYVLFRRSFHLDQAATAARALVTADSQYKLYVNGQFMGRGPARSNPAHIFFDDVDVASQLVVGENVVAVLVHSFGVSNERYILGKGGFLFELNLEMASGPPLSIASDETWKALRADAWDKESPREHSNQGFIEILDLRRLPKSWTGIGFDDSAWGRPFVMGQPPQAPWSSLGPSLVPAPAEQAVRPRLILQVGEVAETPASDPRLIGQQMDLETILPVETVEIGNPAYLLDGSGEPTTILTPTIGRAATLVFDLGREVAGVPTLEVEGIDGAEIDVGFSEFLRDGKPAMARSLGSVGVISTADRLILSPGRQDWERFFYGGIRYLQLTFRNCRQPVRVHSVGVRMINYPYQDRGSFDCSDPLLTRLWEAGQATVKACTYDTFVDCPWREKGQWVDMVTPLTSYMCFGAREVAEMYLRTLALSQDDDGRFRAPYPSFFNIELPEQTMWWGMHLWQYYLHFGDVETLRDLYPNLRKANRWFERYLESPGLLSTAHWMMPVDFALTKSHAWVWIDWGYMKPYLSLPDDERYAQSAALNCIYVGFLEDYARIARALGHNGTARRFEVKAAKVRKLVNEVYWSEEDGYYFDDVKHKLRGDQASFLAILYQIAPADRWQRICNALLNEKYEVGYSSPHFYHYVFAALEKAGLYPLALDAMRVRFGNMLARGATTMWEVFDPGESDSYCHGYSTGPTYSLSSSVLGVRPTGPGFSTFAVRPQTDSLEWAEGAVPTPTGLIGVAWQKELASSRFTLSLDVPENTRATVWLPFLPDANGVGRVADTIFYQGGSAVPGLGGVGNVTRTRLGVRLTAEPGHYVLVSE